MSTKRVCFSGSVTCTGCDPCPACAEFVSKYVLPVAMVSGGFNQSRQQAEGFFRGYAMGWQRLHQAMIMDPQVKGRLHVVETAEASPVAPQGSPEHQSYFGPPTFSPMGSVMGAPPMGFPPGMVAPPLGYPPGWAEALGYPDFPGAPANPWGHVPEQVQSPSPVVESESSPPVQREAPTQAEGIRPTRTVVARVVPARNLSVSDVLQAGGPIPAEPSNGVSDDGLNGVATDKT